MLKLKLQYFDHLMQRTDSWKRSWCWERLNTDDKDEKWMTEDEIIGWHHHVNGHEFEQALRVSDGQGSLACCSPWGHKELDTTEWLNWTDGGMIIILNYNRKLRMTISDASRASGGLKDLCPFLCVCVSRLVVSNCLQPHGLEPTRLLCPWNSPGENTRMSCHFLLQGIFLTQGSNLGLLHCRQILYHLIYREVPL